MNVRGLSPDFFRFINEFADNDLSRLLLANPAHLEREELHFAVLQMELRKRNNTKFKEYLSNPKFLFPDRSLSEQASGIAAARYTASLISPGLNIVDLTAGLGVNSIEFAKTAQTVISVELDPWRAEVLDFNKEILNIENLEVINQDSIHWLEQSREKFDVIYVDPARRDGQGRRSFLLEDYTPSLLDLTRLASLKSRRLIAKVSPMLDLTYLKRHIPEIGRFHIVDYRKECKEILLDIYFESDERELIRDNEIKCVEIAQDGSVEFNEFILEDNGNIPACLFVKNASQLADGGWIYDPYPSIQKAMVELQLLNRHKGLKKLASNSHLFYSDSLDIHFPGRKFRILRSLNKNMLKKMKGTKINVLSRNHPFKADQISKEFQFIPSGNKFLIATSVSSAEKILLETEEF